MVRCPVILLSCQWPVVLRLSWNIFKTNVSTNVSFAVTLQMNPILISHSSNCVWSFITFNHCLAYYLYSNKITYNTFWHMALQSQYERQKECLAFVSMSMFLYESHGCEEQMEHWSAGTGSSQETQTTEHPLRNCLNHLAAGDVWIALLSVIVC